MKIIDDLRKIVESFSVDLELGLVSNKTYS